MLLVLKMHYKNQSPEITTYRDYKKFSNENFHSEFVNEIGSNMVSLLVIFIPHFQLCETNMHKLKKDTLQPNKKLYGYIVESSYDAQISPRNKYIK